MKAPVLILLLSLVCAAADPVTYYVATNGNDAWSGKSDQPARNKKDGPFATLERARDAVREMRKQDALPSGGVKVLIRGGDYLRRESFALTREDSGTAEAPVVFAAYPNEKPRLIGGRKVTGWSGVGDPNVYLRLGLQARKAIRQTDLKKLGITDPGRFASRGFGREVTPSHLELFFQNKRQTVARWPDTGFTKITSPADLEPHDDDHGRLIGDLKKGFYYEGDRPRRWAETANIWVHGYWAWDWANSYEEIATIDPAKRLVTTKPPYGHYGFRTRQRFYFLNVLEELDQPGEYYVDAGRRILYFWPPADLKTSEALVSVLDKPFVTMRDVSHVRVRGLTFEAGRSSGIEIEGGEQVRVQGCTVRNVGNHGIVVRNGSRHVVESNDIYQAGDSGIILEGGDRKTLTAASHEARNNDIHHIADWSRTYQPGIRLIGVGHTVRNNHIHDSPHNAILLNGNEHLIEFNDIHHVCLETGDAGAFYLGRDWTERGNRVRNNYFHHTGLSEGGKLPIGTMAVYLDDCASGVEVFGNIFFKCQRAAFVGGGRDNRVENNVFIDCDPAVDVDARGTDPRPVWRNMIYKTMKDRLEEMNARQPPYSERYPQLKTIDPYLAGDKGVPPDGTRIRRNVIAGKGAHDGTWLRLRTRGYEKSVEIGDNFVAEDSAFFDRAKEDFRLKPDFAGFLRGFQAIPSEKIGLQKDEFRDR
ncbi:MAG: right-handed parallel beta-helix repeat-containing protein [Bryobacteraceae bacterium]